MILYVISLHNFEDIDQNFYFILHSTNYVMQT